MAEMPAQSQGWPPAVMRALGSPDGTAPLRLQAPAPSIRPPSQLPALSESQGSRLRSQGPAEQQVVNRNPRASLAQLVEPAWANRPDTAGNRPAFKPRPQLQTPTESEALLDINQRTTEPIQVQGAQTDAPRAVGMKQPSLIYQQLKPTPHGISQHIPANPPVVQSWRDRVDQMMPPMSPVKGLNDSGMNIPIHLRMHGAPQGSGYITRPPRDLEYSTSVFEEEVFFTKSLASCESWKQSVIGHTPRDMNPPDLTMEALNSSLRLYMNSKETYAVRRLQRAWRMRKHRAQGRAWRDGFLMQRAAILIQRYARRRLAMRKIRTIECTLTLQRLLRGWVGRRRAKRVRLTAEESTQVAAAILLQKIGRRYVSSNNTRRWRRQANEASTMISKVVIGHTTRKRVKKELELRVRVVMKLQQVARCFLATLAERRSATGQTRAATKIQALWRGRLTRIGLVILFAEQAEAALEIQRIVRGKKGRMLAAAKAQEAYANSKPFRCAVMIQRIWRRRKVFRMLGHAKQNLVAMRRLCVANDRLELVEVLLRENTDNLPLHGILDENGNTLLHVAAQRNNTAALQALIEHGGNIDIQNDKGFAPIHSSVMNQAEDCLKYLLNKKANINLMNIEGYSALHLACSFDNSQAVRLLGEKRRLKVNSRTEEGFTPLHLAAQNDELSIQTINFLMALKLDLDAKEASTGQTALHMAADVGNDKLIAKIVEKEVQVNSADVDGRTPLHIACIAGTSECANNLVVGRGKIQMMDNEGWMPHHYAAQGGHRLIVDMIVNGQDLAPDIPTVEGWTALHIAATGSTPEYFPLIRLLIGSGSAPDARDLEGRMPIHLAAKSGAMESFSYLLESGNATAEVLDYEGQTPMFTALMYDQFNLGRYCCKMGCNFMHQDYQGRSMLMLAVQHQHMHWVQFFLRVKFDATLKDANGQNCVHYAARYAGAEMIHTIANDPICKEILPHQLLSAQDNKGWSPVHMAGHCGNLEAMEALIGVGSNIELQANDGECALHCACREGHAGLVHALMRANAMQWPDRTGKRPIHIAALGPKPSKYLLHEDALACGYPIRGNSAAGFEDGGRKNDCVRVILALHEYGVDINAKNDLEDGMSALHYAARDGRCEFEAYDSVDILIRLGASLKFVTHGWKTPQMLAAENGHTECSELMLECAEMTRLEWIERQAEEELTGQLMQKVYRGQVARARVWKMRRQRSALWLQKHWRGRQVRVTVSARKRELRWACNVMGEEYKKRLTKIAFRAVLAKARALRQSKLLQAAVEEENHAKLQKLEVEAFSVLFLQRIIRGRLARKRNPREPINRLFMELEALCMTDEDPERGEAIIDEFENMNLTSVERLTKGITREVDKYGNTLLHVCARNGSAEMLRILLNQDMFVDTLNIRRVTPLHQAVSNGHIALTRALLRHGADANACQVDGVSALHMATINRNSELVNFLLKSKADVNIRSNDGSTPMHEAASVGALAIANALKVKGGNMDEHDEMGRTPLMLAGENGHQKLCEFFVKEGKADVEEKDNEGQNVVLHATMAGELVLVRSLLLNGANSNVVDNEGWTLLHFAASAAHYELCELMVHSYSLSPNDLNKDGQTPMHLACDGKSRQIVQLLGNANADLTLRDESSRAPIHLAAQNDCWPVVDALLRLGNSPNLKDGDGWTPLIYACAMGFHKPFVGNMLRQEGTKIDMSDNDGNTPLHHAILQKNDPLIAELIDAGANVNAVNNKLQSPLILAAEKGVFKAFVALMEHGASSFQFDDHNWSVLNYAIKCEDPKMVKHMVPLALNAAPPLNTHNDEGFTPLVVALRELSHDPALVSLVLHGSLVDKVDKLNRTELFHAIEQHNTRIVKELIANVHVNIIHMDENDMLPIHMCFVCDNVPQEIKVAVVEATPIEMLGEGYWENGNSVHHYACMEGNIEIVKMLKRGGDLMFKRKNYKRLSALEVAKECDQTECADWVQGFYDEVREEQMAEQRAYEKKQFDAAARIQSMRRGILGRQRASRVRMEKLAAEEAARQAAEDARLAEELRVATNASTMIQKVYRIKLCRRAVQRVRECHDEKRRQDLLFIEAKAYAGVLKEKENTVIRYCSGAVLRSEISSEKLEERVEALRKCIDERMGRCGQLTPGHKAGVPWPPFSKQATMLGSKGPLLDFCKRVSVEEGETLDEAHEEIEYPSLGPADVAVQEGTQATLVALHTELKECKEYIVTVLRQVASVGKDVMVPLKGQIGGKTPAAMIQRANKECDVVTNLVAKVQMVGLDQASVDELVPLEQNLNRVLVSVATKGCDEAVGMIQSMLDNLELVQLANWELAALQRDLARKTEQLSFYENAAKAVEMSTEIKDIFDDTGLEEEAETIVEKMALLVQINWSGVKATRSSNALISVTEVLQSAIGVDPKNAAMMCKLSDTVKAAVDAKFAWEEGERAKVQWRLIRQSNAIAKSKLEILEPGIHQEDVSGLELNEMSQEAWQLAMCLKDAEQRALSSKMENLALHGRAKALFKLEDELEKAQKVYIETLDDATRRATDLEEAMTEASALDEAAAMKKVLSVIDMSRRENLANSATLESAAESMIAVAHALREEEAKEAEVGEELNEIDIADIDEMEQLVPVLRTAADNLSNLEETRKMLVGVQEEHLRRAIGEREGDEVGTPRWPLPTGWGEVTDLMK